MALKWCQNKVDLEVAILEALPILSAAEMEEEGSPAREEAEENAMERVRFVVVVEGHRLAFCQRACILFSA